MEREDIIDRFLTFFNEFYRDDLTRAAAEGWKSVEIDFSNLDKFDVELSDYLLENPEEVLPIVEDVIKQFDTGLVDAKLKIRFFNLPESKNIRIRNIRSEHVGKMITVDGMVKRASEIRPEIAETVFRCPECGNEITIIQTERIITAPVECDSCRNRKGFKLVGQKMKMYDARWIVVEEPFEIVTGERPSTIGIYLKEDLTSPRMQNKTDPGNRIKVVGVMKQLPKRMKDSRSRQMDIFLDAIHVESVEAVWEELEITEEDEMAIIEVGKDPLVFQKLIGSIAPSMYEMDDVKEAIILQLFGGEPKALVDGTRIRGNIHLLLVGDPSAGKSQLLQLVTKVMPRGRYVSGSGITAAGITATVIKDEELMGGWVLEAGALIMANRSVCAIDEFSKVAPNDRVALQEAMSMETISIAKASIVATLPAQTAILAGGNPKFGRFDPFIPIREQVDIDEVLLTRFDLKFALRDLPNPEVDTKVADHILKVRHFEEEAKPVFSTEFLRKYIAYARSRIHPVLTKEAGEKLKEFYLEMRSKAGEEAPISITLRQYESLIRMAEASAKIRLSSIVDPEDVDRSIRLMKKSLRDFGFEPETGKIDIDRAEGLRLTSVQRNRVRVMLDIVDELTGIYGRDIPIEEVLKRARVEGVDKPDEILKKMQSEGILYSSRPDVVTKI
jgi:replicative DNA helicase Mcm